MGSGHITPGITTTAARAPASAVHGRACLTLASPRARPRPAPGVSAPAVRQACVPAPQVVDTTGAGDCFTAAYVVAVLEGLPPAGALRFASAAASLCVRQLGAIPSLPGRAEVDELLAGL